MRTAKEHYVTLEIKLKNNKIFVEITIIIIINFGRE